jgi:hypothetical protein
VAYRARALFLVPMIGSAGATLVEAAMGDVNKKENEKTGQQGTNEPWKRPGQTSQSPYSEAPKKEDREREQKDNETS